MIVFTILVPGTVMVWIPLALVYSLGVRVGLWEGLLAAMGWPVLVAGLALYFWTFWEFLTRGRGSPSPVDPPKRLVVRGAYHWVRNPMYVGVTAYLTGLGLAMGSLGLLAHAAITQVVFHLMVVLYEEPGLLRRFGGEYREYCQRVNRWLPKPPNTNPS